MDIRVVRSQFRATYCPESRDEGSAGTCLLFLELVLIQNIMFRHMRDLPGYSEDLVGTQGNPLSAVASP